MPSRGFLLLPVSFLVVCLASNIHSAISMGANLHDMDWVKIALLLTMIVGLMFRDVITWCMTFAWCAFVVAFGAYLLYLISTDSRVASELMHDFANYGIDPATILVPFLSMFGVLITLMVPVVRQQFWRGKQLSQ